MNRVIKFEWLRFRHSKAWIWFALAFFCLLLWPNLARVSSSAGDYADDYAEYVALNRWDEGLYSKATTIKASRVSVPTTQNLVREMAVLTKLVDEISKNKPNAAVMTRLEYQLRRGIVRQIKSGRVYEWKDERHSFSLSLVTMQEKTMELKYMVKHRITKIPNTETKLPGVMQVARTLRNFTSFLWIITFFAVWSAYYLIDDNRLRTVDFLNVVPIEKCKQFGAKMLVFGGRQC